ncbi:hypothetical protein WG66_011428 [Moniliophthora roreri]|nr:hypothetical protein WG66_011428 [Moniliophthora roreri]
MAVNRLNTEGTEVLGGSMVSYDPNFVVCGEWSILRCWRHRQSLHATPPPTNRFSLVKRPSSLIRYSTLSFTTLHSQVLIPGLMVRKRSLLSASMMFSNPTPHLPPYQRRVLQF